MKKLGIRNATLLLMGAKTTGTFDEAYTYVEEELFVDEADTIFEFCEYLDKYVGGAGRNNIEQLFEAFINPNNEEAVKFTMDVRDKIAEIKGHLPS
ncbi:MAG: hypothetical protein ACTSX1_12475 [Candidatus Heimdallarchaeaceae archaeon]